MEKRLVVFIILLSLISAGVIYLISRAEPRSKSIKDNSYTSIERVLSNTETDQLLWNDETLFIRSEEKLHSYLKGEVSTYDINQNSVVGIYNDETVVCTWINNLIFNPSSFATEIKVITLGGKVVKKKKYHKTYKIDSCNEYGIKLSNAYPILKEGTLSMDWDWKENRLAEPKNQVEIRGDENLEIWIDGKKEKTIPMINTTHLSAYSRRTNQIAISTHTGEVWVINLTQ